MEKITAITEILWLAILGAIPTVLICILVAKLIGPIIKTAEKDFFNRYYKYQKEQEECERIEKELSEIEADIKEHLKADGFDTEPKPFTQDDMRKWQMRNK